MTAFTSCILHIGTEKTGSTSLQRLLALNRDRLLAEQGIFVPKSLSPRSQVLNHSRLTTYAVSEFAGSADLLQAAGVTATAGLPAHREMVREAFATEVAGRPAGDLRLLLSNEHCHTRLASIEEVERVRQLLAPVADDITIVVYLRPQFELALSAHSTALRSGHFNIDPLPIFAEKLSPGRRWLSPASLDYDQLLDRWAQVFGEARVRPCLYAKAELQGGDVVRDFAHRAGIALDGLVLPERQNEALGAAAKLFLRTINTLAKSKVPVTPKQRARIIEAMPKREGAPADLPARQAVARFQAQFADINERVRTRWFADRPTLFEIDLERFPENPTRNEATPTDMMEVALEVMLSLVGRL